MFILKNWALCPWVNEVYAEGFVFDNPKFAQGHSITTSIFRKWEPKEDAIVVTTFSGSRYELRFENCGHWHEESFRELTHTLGLPADVVENCLTRQKEAREKFRERVDELLKPHELFLQIVGYHAVVAFYKQEEETKEVNIIDHIGMFQDSILVQNSGQVDFRFFPKEFNQIEPYHWSDGLERIHFENIGEPATFKGTGKIIELSSNSITVVESSSYKGEGLFSPDCVNEKNALGSLLEEVK